MPLVRIDLRRAGKHQYARARPLSGDHGSPRGRAALRSFLPRHHSYRRLVFIQITLNTGRTLEQKKALYARIAELLAKEPGIRPEDVLINLVECAKENWSFGNGLATYSF